MPSRATLRLIAASALCYALAFNLTFFCQELFLVLPKALVPGLNPVLFHNNHDWSGSAPIAELLQGTGALATIVMAFVAMAVLARVRAPTWRLLLFWLAYCGLFMALPQVVMGAFLPGNDVARALRYLGFGPAKLEMAAVVALVAILQAAMLLARRFLPKGDAWVTVTIPAVIGTLLVLPFRVPRNWIEVAFVPLVVLVAGVPLIQLLSGRAIAPPLGETQVLAPAVTLVALLAFFQLVLARGIPFY